MANFLSRFPDGAAGLALALLRFSCALNAFFVLAALPFISASLGFVLSAIAALALVAGFGTRAASMALAGAAAAAAFAPHGELRFAMIAHAGGYAALALLGPGAYSIDAKLFGRRVIRLEPRSPDRGSGD